MSANTANYVNQVTAGRFAEWAAVSGVAVSRLNSASAGGTLSNAEMRDLIAAAKLLSYTIAAGTQSAAVTENAAIAHPTCKKVNLALMSENLF
jgi:hypothetical protein